MGRLTCPLREAWDGHTRTRATLCATGKLGPASAAVAPGSPTSQPPAPRACCGQGRPTAPRVHPSSHSASPSEASCAPEPIATDALLLGDPQLPGAHSSRGPTAPVTAPLCLPASVLHHAAPPATRVPSLPTVADSPASAGPAARASLSARVRVVLLYFWGLRRSVFPGYLESPFARTPIRKSDAEVLFFPGVLWYQISHSSP